MSGQYDFSSPFRTPSKSKPAIVYQEISDLSFNNSSIYIEDPKEEITDEEIAKVDEMLDLHDTDEDEDLKTLEKSTIFDDGDEAIPGKSHTPSFTPRKKAFEARIASQSATVMELTKLVNQMKDDSDDAKSTNSKISTILLIVVAVVAILFASANRPYCNEYSWYPCQQCPRNAKCSLFSIQSCLSPNYTIYDNQVCIRNDSTGLLSYQLGNIAKDYLETRAYRVDCLGSSKISKKVQKSKLFDFLFDQTAKEYSENMPDTTYTHAFSTMISLFENNEDVYKIVLGSDQSFSSSRFQSLGSCLITKYHFFPSVNEPKTIAQSSAATVTATEPPAAVTPQEETKPNASETVVEEQTKPESTTTPTIVAEEEVAAPSVTEQPAATSSETTTTTEQQL